MQIIILLILTLLFGCTKPKDSPEPIKEVKNGVFICNEGNFMYGNASMSLYDKDDKSIQNQIFYNVNNFPLGDVCQSMKIIDNKGFIVVNNSGKVVVVELPTCKYLGAIKELTSPRYIEHISDSKIYITDLYANAITIANPVNYEVIGTIQIGASTEQMARFGDFVFVTSWSYGDKIYKIDARNDKIVATINVTKQPNSIVLDKNNKIWVLSDGGYTGTPSGQAMACLTKIDPITATIEKQFEFANMSLSPSELTIDKAKENLLFLCGGWGSEGGLNGCYKMDVTANELPKTPFIPENGALFYALGVDPKNNDIYISDAIDYAQKGFVIRYDENATMIDKFKTDISPGAFCFF